MLSSTPLSLGILNAGPPAWAFEAPNDAVETARAALAATDLLDSFGCADLVHDGERWLVLEVGTDGACGHVDRDVGDAALAHELDRRFAEAFWTWAAAAPPWGARAWCPRRASE